MQKLKLYDLNKKLEVNLHDTGLENLSDMITKHKQFIKKSKR